MSYNTVNSLVAKDKEHVRKGERSKGKEKGKPVTYMLLIMRYKDLPIDSCRAPTLIILFVPNLM